MILEPVLGLVWELKGSRWVAWQVLSTVGLEDAVGKEDW